MTKAEVLFVGIDWATQKHDVCVVDTQGEVVGERQFKHSGDGLVSMLRWLLELANDEAERLAVAIEVNRGPVVETLKARQLAVFSINPKQLDRFRDRFSVAGAKDDRLDARVLAQSLRTDQHVYREVKVVAAELVGLREWSRIAEELKKEQGRLGRQMYAQLARYYPQMVELGKNRVDEWILALWKKASTPEQAQHKRKYSIQKLLSKHRVRRINAAGVLEILRDKPVQVAPGVTEAAVAHIELLVERLEVVNRQLKNAHRQLDKQLDKVGAKESPSEENPSGQDIEQRDVEILLSLPGVGRIVLATLLCEAHEAIAQRDYQALRALAGVAPVTKRSGKSLVVKRRQACNPRVREALYHWSRIATQCEEPSRAKYRALRARGCSHGRALRTVGDRLLYVATSMLRRRQTYDPRCRGAGEGAPAEPLTSAA